MQEQEFYRILKVARLKLTDEEKKRIRADIEEIVEYFNKIDRVKVEEESAYQPIHVPTKMRKDKILPFAEVKGLTRQSKLHNGYIVGPKL